MVLTMPDQERKFLPSSEVKSSIFGSNPEELDPKNTFQFPKEWRDDSRMNVLFAPFRPRSLDPVAWDSKMKFWDSLIQDFCLYYKTPSMSQASLKTVFSRNGKYPACLGTVFEELQRSQKIVLATEYNNTSLTSSSLVTWLLKSVIKFPLEWTLNKLKSPFATKPDPENTSFVYILVAKSISEEFYNNITQEQRGKLMPITEVATIAKVKDENIITILKPLLEDGKVAVVVMPPEVLVKFAKEPAQRVVITEVDRGIYHLEKNERILTESIETLENEKEFSLNNVKTCLKTDRKQMAKSWLRRKRELEKYIEKRTNALDNIRRLLDQLRQIESDSLVLGSYRQGIAALKNSLAESGLTEESSDATMAELEDVLDVTKDIDDIISRPLDGGEDIDLDAELVALLEEDRNPFTPSAGGNMPVLDSLPGVPDDIKTEEELKERLKALSL